jgi:hypothetical protein
MHHMRDRSAVLRYPSESRPLPFLLFQGRGADAGPWLGNAGAEPEAVTCRRNTGNASMPISLPVTLPVR